MLQMLERVLVKYELLEHILHQEHQHVLNDLPVHIHLLDRAVEQIEFLVNIHQHQDPPAAQIVRLVNIQILARLLEQIELLELMLQMLERVLVKYEQQEHILHLERRYALSDLLEHIHLLDQAVEHNVLQGSIHQLDQAVEQVEMLVHILLIQDLQAALIVQLANIQILVRLLVQIEMLEPMHRILGLVLVKHVQQEHILHQEHQFELIEMLVHIHLQVRAVEQTDLLANTHHLVLHLALTEHQARSHQMQVQLRVQVEQLENILYQELQAEQFEMLVHTHLQVQVVEQIARLEHFHHYLDHQVEHLDPLVITQMLAHQLDLHDLLDLFEQQVDDQVEQAVLVVLLQMPWQQLEMFDQLELIHKQGGVLAKIEFLVISRIQMPVVAQNDLEVRFVAQADDHHDQCDLLAPIRHQIQQLVLLDLQGLIHPFNLRHAQAVMPIPIQVQAHQAEHHEIPDFTAAIGATF